MCERIRDGASKIIGVFQLLSVFGFYIFWKAPIFTTPFDTLPRIWSNVPASPRATCENVVAKYIYTVLCDRVWNVGMSELEDIGRSRRDDDEPIWAAAVIYSFFFKKKVKFIQERKFVKLKKFSFLELEHSVSIDCQSLYSTTTCCAWWPNMPSCIQQMVKRFYKLLIFRCSPIRPRKFT